MLRNRLIWFVDQGKNEERPLKKMLAVVSWGLKKLVTDTIIKWYKSSVTT